VKIVKNTSGFDTRVLRRIIIQAHSFIRKHEGAPAAHWKTLQVIIRGRDLGRHTSGCAYLGGDKMWMTLPRKDLTARGVLHLAYHELMHVFGYQHRAFKDLSDAEAAALIPVDYPILLKPTRKSSSAEVKAKRIAALLSRRARWRSRLKRSQNALRRIERRLRYYERQVPELFAAAREKHEAG